jgi:hypothetical protein
LVTEYEQPLGRDVPEGNTRTIEPVVAGRAVVTRKVTLIETPVAPAEKELTCSEASVTDNAALVAEDETGQRSGPAAAATTSTRIAGSSGQVRALAAGEWCRACRSVNLTSEVCPPRRAEC